MAITESRELLRHTLATLAYRAAKCLRDTPAGFADFRASVHARTPAQILAHMGDLFDWACELAQGRRHWHDSDPLPWESEVQRFFKTLHNFDALLASDLELACAAGKLFQGPIADALTHTGQIALLRRMAESPIRAENYYSAKIVSGEVGEDQPPAVREF